MLTVTHNPRLISNNYKIPIGELDIPTKIVNTLILNGIATVEQLLQSSRESLIKIRNIGPSSIILLDMGLKEKMGRSLPRNDTTNTYKIISDIEKENNYKRQMEELNNKYCRLENLYNYLLHSRFKMSHAKDDKPTDHRNIQIITLLEKGSFTLQEVANIYHISRERVRQVYLQILGHAINSSRSKELRKIEKNRKKEFHDNLEKFICAGCKKSITWGEAKNRHKYCSDCYSTWKLHRRDPQKNNICKTCGKKFHPFQSMGCKTSKTKGIFCSQKCYMKSGSFGLYTTLRICKICGTQFKDKPIAKYCKSCRITEYRKVNRECSKRNYLTRKLDK